MIGDVRERSSRVLALGLSGSYCVHDPSECPDR